MAPPISVRLPRRSAGCGRGAPLVSGQRAKILLCDGLGSGLHRQCALTVAIEVAAALGLANMGPLHRTCSQRCSPSCTSSRRSPLLDEGAPEHMSTAVGGLPTRLEDNATQRNAIVSIWEATCNTRAWLRINKRAFPTPGAGGYHDPTSLIQCVNPVTHASRHRGSPALPHSNRQNPYSSPELALLTRPGHIPGGGRPQECLCCYARRLRRLRSKYRLPGLVPVGP